MNRVKNFQMKCEFDGYSDFEMQLKEQCDIFFKETKKYPTAIITNEGTYIYWEQVMEGEYDASNESPRKEYYYDPEDPECDCRVGSGTFCYGTKIELKTLILDRIPVGTYYLRFGDAPIFDGEEFEEEEDSYYLLAA